MVAHIITDYDIQALIDHELDQEQEEFVRARVESDEKARVRYQQLLRQKDILKSWWVYCGWWQA